MFSLFPSPIKHLNSVGKLLIAWFFLAVFSQSVVACSRERGQTANEFVRLFSTGSLSVDAAKQLMGNGSVADRHGAYWQIHSDRCSSEIVLHAESQNESASEAELRLNLESGLLLSDLEKNLGSWQLVFSSKTSSVSFRVASKNGEPTLVFVHLYTPKPTPDSPVLSIKLRREEETQR